MEGRREGEKKRRGELKKMAEKEECESNNRGRRTRRTLQNEKERGRKGFIGGQVKQVVM